MRFRKELTVKINPDLSFTGMADFLRQYPHEARKLGFLRKHKFRSRVGASEAAGAKQACLRRKPRPTGDLDDKFWTNGGIRDGYN